MHAFCEGLDYFAAMVRALDDIDKKLLGLLQKGLSSAPAVLGRKVGLSASAVSRRIHRLEKQGVIERRVAIVNIEAFGVQTHFIVSLSLEHERPSPVLALRKTLLAEEVVQQFYSVTGAADFVLVLVLPHVAAFESFMTRLMHQHEVIKSYSTQVVLAIGKRGLLIPVGQ